MLDLIELREDYSIDDIPSEYMLMDKEKKRLVRVMKKVYKQLGFSDIIIHDYKYHPYIGFPLS